MNFFEHQAQAHRYTKWLIVLLVLAVLGTTTLLHFVLLVFGFFGRAYTNQPHSWWDPGFFFATLLVTSALVALASYTRMLTLRGGGRAVAEMLGAKFVTTQGAKAREKRLVNIVEEMSIASGVPMPQVYVLEQESGINAFASGHTPSDAAITVTRGALDMLNREELQGVIAHEFSHILNGDMRINMRLISIVFGIMCVALVGKLILRAQNAWDISITSNRRRSASGKWMVLAFLFVVIGSIGEFFARVIQAAITRQREFLADASSVQFTRNPVGIVSALKKIGGFTTHSYLSAPRAGEISHLFFSDAFQRHLGGLLRTHPPLEERIRRIDPSFDGRFAEAIADTTLDERRGAAPGPDALGLGFAGAPGGDAKIAISGMVGRLGEIGRIEHAQSILQGIPEAILAAAREPFSAVAGAYALLIMSDQATADDQFSLLERAAPRGMLERVKMLSTPLATLSRTQKLAWTHLACAQLKQLSREQRAAVNTMLSALAAVDAHIDVFEYVLIATLKRRLAEPNAAARMANATLHTRVSTLTQECVLILSAMASIGNEAERADQAYRAGLERLGLVRNPDTARVAWGRSLESGLSVALENARASVPALKAQLVEACIIVAAHNDSIGLDEAEALRAFCDALGCPHPPFLDNV